MSNITDRIIQICDDEKLTIDALYESAIEGLEVEQVLVFTPRRNTQLALRAHGLDDLLEQLARLTGTILEEK